MNSDDSLHWRRHHWRGSAADFHARDLPVERAVWWCDVDSPALIVGSSQSVDMVSDACATEQGFDVVRRRSGGGMVFVHPSDSVWFDITITRNDPLWTDDVSTSMLWLGDVCVSALSPWVQSGVWTDRFNAGDFGKDICFASAAPGEVFADGMKLVGISQRRTREGARFQCVLYREWNPHTWAPCIRDARVADAAAHIGVHTVTASALDIVEAVFAALPQK